MKIADNIIKIDDGEIVFDNGEIFNQDNPMVILGAKDMSDGMKFIYDVLEKLYPGHNLMDLDIIQDGGKVFDVIKILYDGVAQEVWFNITDFYKIS